MANIEIINLAQRISGVLGFILITLQIFLSTNIKFIKFHKINGITAYSVIFFHPIFMILLKYFLGSGLDPFYVYVDVCLLCDGKYEMFINFGRIAFLLLTATVATAFFRQKIGLIWRKIHYLNYLVFVFVSLHAKTIGSDTQSVWFNIIFWLAQIIFIYAILKRIKEYYISKSIGS